MPTIGSYFSEPNDRFSVKRSYITHIILRQNTDNYPPSLIDNQITWPSIAFPNIVQYMTLLPEFLPWNSNSYSLDYIITAYWYTVSPSPTPIPNSGAVLRYKWNSLVGSMVLEIEKELANTAVLMNIQPSPGGYWLDPVPSFPI